MVEKTLVKVVTYQEAISTPDLINEMVKFYHEVFGLVLDSSHLVVPERHLGYNWLLVVPKGMTEETAWAKCCELFSACKTTQGFTKRYPPTGLWKIRDAENPYAIWLRDRNEADEENKNKCLYVCVFNQINGVTLIERLLLELWRWWANNKQHTLDLGNGTLCIGSYKRAWREWFTIGEGGGLWHREYVPTDIPIVYFLDGVLNIKWCGPSYESNDLRARSVIECE